MLVTAILILIGRTQCLHQCQLKAAETLDSYGYFSPSSQSAQADFAFVAAVSTACAQGTRRLKSRLREQSPPARTNPKSKKGFHPFFDLG